MKYPERYSKKAKGLAGQDAVILTAMLQACARGILRVTSTTETLSESTSVGPLDEQEVAESMAMNIVKRIPKGARYA